MTRMLGPGSSVFAVPHSGLAVWNKPLDAVRAGTIGNSTYRCPLELKVSLLFATAGIIGSDFGSVEEAVNATKEYGHSSIFDLGTNPKAGTRPWEVAEWMFSDDGTESMSIARVVSRSTH